MILLITAQFNARITHKLQRSAIDLLQENQIDYTVIEVPGAVELPIASQKFIQELKPQAVIALGCVIRGETDHYDFVLRSCIDGLTRVSLDLQTPIVQGIIAAPSPDLAWKRKNLGKDYAQTALNMIKLFDQ